MASDAPRPLPTSDIEVAQAASMLPIQEIGARLGLASDDLVPYGHDKAKVRHAVRERNSDGPQGKLVLVTSINPTKAGEGKTTTTVGLGDGLNRIGRQTTICLREPSLGPCFGMKGGAAGGGYAQVVPMEDINLHFTGDFHAIGLANNLLAAAIDNHMHQGNALDLDPRRIEWKRAIDLNDRSLRDVIIGLGGPTESMPRETGFEITAASEVMAIFCLADSLADLRARLEAIQIGRTFSREPVLASAIGVAGAMTALLRDALQPNLVQTLENNPAFVHGGPFANIAHGCNSVMATKTALGLSDIVVTEAGFGADLGAEKFFDIKCRKAGLRPDAAVIVVTTRALKLHGGLDASEFKSRADKTLARGIRNLSKHVETIAHFGVPALVGINVFADDDPEEIAIIRREIEPMGVPVVASDHWARGGAGAEDLARAVAGMLDEGRADFQPLYPDEMPLLDKVRTIVQKVYGAEDVVADSKLRARFRKLDEEGHGRLPICMAKTQYSLSTDPDLIGRPKGFHVPLRDVLVRSGAGFLLVMTGDIMTMPGLPRRPAAESIDVGPDGRISGLF